MHDLKKRYGNWGLVAGAAEGLGAAFARSFAIRGINIILVDVNAVKLSTTASDLERNYGIKTETIVADLSEKESLDGIIHKISEIGCRLLIYNAAYGPVKEFLDNSIEELDYYVNLNSRTPLHLIYAHSYTRY